MSYCNQCGSPLENGVCPKCGANAPSETSAPQEADYFAPNAPRQDNSKMKQCKHCGAQIAKNAKKCPHCGGKNKKPLYKRVWFWILVVLMLLLGKSCFGSGNGEEASSDKTNTTVQTDKTGENQTAEAAEEIKEADKEAENVQSAYRVGDTLHDGDVDIVYMASGDYAESSDILAPAEGNKYIFLKFAFINTSDKNDSSISFYSFECYADGYACEMYYGGEDDLSATLSAGRAASGSVYFEVPENAEEIEVEYEPNMFLDDKITFVYEGTQDSGYTLTVDAAPTEGALQVGDTAEVDELNITYLSCFEDSSDNMFIKPQDGYHYITCELEFENLSDSDAYVSSYEFDCFADGISCNAAYFRDDSISATLSAGRKAQGTVTFEVPEDAAVIEVEYLTNAWTSERVVLNASDY